MEALLEKLGIPADFTRTELVTASQEARELMTKLRIYSNQKQWDKVERLQKEIKALVPMNLKCNQQAIMNKEVRIRWRQGEIDNQEYIRQMKDVLELTLPLESFFKKGEKYLTYEEQTCIQNLMLAMEKNCNEHLTCMLQFEAIYRPYFEKGLYETVSGMYDFIMNYVASILGSLGKYDQSDQYNVIILTGCLRSRRSGAIHEVIYDYWWNHDQRKQKNIPTNIKLDSIKELSKCIFFSRISKSKKNETFYRMKLENLKDNNAL